MTRQDIKYEYMLLECAQPTATKEQLDEFGHDGWLLSTIYQIDGRWIYVFARHVRSH